MYLRYILQVLDLAQIPLLAKERTEEHPIVIGGGPCAYNPEPVADFFDLFNIGEGEEMLPLIQQAIDSCSYYGGGMVRIEAGHYATEVPVVDTLAAWLTEAYPDLTVIPYRDGDPYSVIK